MTMLGNTNLRLLIAGLLLISVCSCTESPLASPPSQPGESLGRIAQLAHTEVGSDDVAIEGVTGEASLARNFYFIFDGSGSMYDSPSGYCRGDKAFRRKVDGAKWAVAEFMRQVPHDVHLGLWVFDGNGSREVVGLGPNNREAFLKAVRGIDARGGTPLAESIRRGVDQLVAQYKRQLGYGEYRLVVVTDGAAVDIPNAAHYAEKHGIPIYTIGLCIGGNHDLRKYSVSYRAADSMADLKAGLEATLAETETFDATEFEGF